MMQLHDRQIIHSSLESDYRTPPRCYAALDQEFHFAADLAANQANHLTSLWFGPDHASEAYRNSLLVKWAEVLTGPGFLNPPFSKTLVNAYNTGRIKVNGEWVEHEKDPEKAKAYDIANWAEKCWKESQAGATIVGVFPFAPQTDWYRKYIFGHTPATAEQQELRPFHAAMQERRLPHRISFLQPDGTPTGNAGVNSVIVVWQPNFGIVGPWQPHQFYWSYR
jgi:hypothetical protein